MTTKSQSLCMAAFLRVCFDETSRFELRECAVSSVGWSFVIQHDGDIPDCTVMGAEGESILLSFGHFDEGRAPYMVSVYGGNTVEEIHEALIGLSEACLVHGVRWDWLAQEQCFEEVPELVPEECEYTEVE